MILALALAASVALTQSGPLPVVALVPLGPVEAKQLEEISTAITDRLNVTVRLERQRKLPPAAYYAPRKRWRAEKLLEALTADPPEGAWKVLAVTKAEISTTKDEIYDWGIGGLGDIGGTACVVSSYLLRKHSRTEEVLLRRLTDLAVHELGHTLGLDHCPTEGCVMRDAYGKLIRSIDSSTGQFCESCRRKLRTGLLKQR